MQNSLISIIVPVYKVEKYLKKCLDSIINQTYKNLEIIIVDDGSPDGCPNICDEYSKKDDRIKVIHQKNMGLSIARNNGIKLATGEYIGFVDSDDYIRYTMYEDMYKAAVNNSAPLVSVLLLYVMDDIDLKNDVVLRSEPIVYNPTNASGKEQVINESPSSCNKLFKR